MMDTKLKEAQQLCKDLEEAVLEDRSLLEHIIDEYVYTLSDNEIRGYQREVNKILGEDWWYNLTQQAGLLGHS